MNPHNPEMQGNSSVQHDDMPNAGHEEQANRAGGQSIRSEDAHEGSSESSAEEKRAESEED